MIDILYNNHWLWMHVLGGGFLTALFYNFIPYLRGNKQLSFFALLIFAILWEVVEYYNGFYMDEKRFIVDSLQDIIGAGLASIFVVWRK